MFLFHSVLKQIFEEHFLLIITKNKYFIRNFQLNLFFKKQIIKFVKNKLKTEEKKTELNNKNIVF